MRFIFSLIFAEGAHLGAPVRRVLISEPVTVPIISKARTAPQRIMLELEKTLELSRQRKVVRIPWPALRHSSEPWATCVPIECDLEINGSDEKASIPLS